MKKAKKTISKFLNSEEGKILNSDVVKMGITLGIVGAAAMSDPDIVSGVTSNFKHKNYFTGNSGVSAHLNFSANLPVAGINNTMHVNYNESTGTALNSHYSHNAHASHASHSSHGSHGSHGSHSSHSSHGSHSSHSSHSSHGSHGSHGSHARGGWC